MTEYEPVVLQEDARTGDRFLVYSTDRGPRLDIRYEGEALWMTQAQMAELFGRDVSVVSRHIGNILEEGERDEAASLRKMQTTGGRPATLYSLDMVISVGYRVSSAQATLFRRWATDTLVRFATKGFVVDAIRLKQPENADRLAELREIIRDIRSDEANVYRELRRICSMCQDYDGASPTWRDFYMKTQAKIVYAVTSKTPAEIIQARADATQPDMGLRSWPHDNIRKDDVAVSKNYFGDTEIKELNRLTTILLDIFEDQAELGRLVMMDDARALLDKQLASLGRAVLAHGGQVASADAKRHAERQYALYDRQRKSERHADADRAIKALKDADKGLPSSRSRS